MKAMKETMDKLEKGTNEYMEKESVRIKKAKKMNKDVVKELRGSNIVHETGSSIHEKKKNKESKLGKINGDFIVSGESNKSDTLGKERMMEMGSSKKKKEKMESESNKMHKVLFEDKESEEIKTLERECRIEKSNSRKTTKKKKENELEEMREELFEVKDDTKTAILEKENMIDLNKDKKKKSKKNNKVVIISEESEGNSKCREVGTLEDDSMIEPENNDKIKKRQNKEDIELNGSEARKHEVIIDSSNSERNKMRSSKKKKEKKESESNKMYKVLFEDEESEEIKTLEREWRIETRNSRKNTKKKKENELEEMHKELVEVEDDTKSAILEKESMIELNKNKKKNKKKESVSENVNKEVIISEESEGNSKCREVSTLEGDTMIEPGNNDKIKKRRNKEDIELNGNEARIHEIIVDTSNSERNKKWKNNMEVNKESTIDEDLRNSSTQSITSEAVDKKRERKGKKKLDNEVLHLDNKTESSLKNKEKSKKNKLPHSDEEQKSLSNKKKRETIGDSDAVERSSTRKKTKKRKLDYGTEEEIGNKKKSKKDNEKNDVAEKDAQKAQNKKINDKSPNSEPKRVRFSSNVEVFPINEDDSTGIVYCDENGEGSTESIYDEKNDFSGRRFSPYEDQLVRDAVQKYIDTNQLGENGVQKIMNCMGTPEVKYCWKEISKDLPWRTPISVYHRGRLLLRMSEYGEIRGCFSEEEKKRIMDFRAENGPKWAQLSKELQRTRGHIKDAYRRQRLREVSKGKWTQEEYQKLFDLVHENICAKIHETEKKKNPMIRDGISWEAISERMKTRAMSTCCAKWYSSLASPLVREDKWSDTDDYRLLDALYYQEGCCEEDVDWDNLVQSRPGEYCFRRWKEMVQHTGEYKERSFRDKINLLKERYDITMLKYVEALKNKNKGQEVEDEHDADED